MMKLKSVMTSALLRLPPGLRIFAVVGSGAGLMCGLGLLVLWIQTKFTVHPMVWIIGAVVVAMIAAAIIGIVRMIRKRKVNQADAAIREGAAASTSSVNDPNEIARIDQLRKDFLAAYNRFCEHNEEGVYSLPFLLLVGEPGSGKTEAVRHSNINFPAGLNSAKKGAGGTFNMDWWFTTDAIILDTAGRLMFEETDEWNELLRQLNRVRPHCPINGMLLVIPTDSLLQDSAEQIEEKADRIAQQINIVKRELGLRFPVYVIVSKCDLITGFREFFAHLNDPVLQHQILGWSNPADLDEPFKPESIDRHLEEVQERLRRRRLSQLFDPPNVDSYSDRRADKVDALYAFPEELMRIKSRLRLYMEKIFSPGPWTKKPPFIRGLFFTSSMQEGQEIDTALAEMLGVSVKDLPKGRTYQKDKAYFLKDLLVQKVFPEKGLVSRAANAVQNYQRNKRLVQTTGTCAVVLAALVLIWTWLDFRSTIGEPRRWWSQVAIAVKDDHLRPAITQRNGNWRYHDEKFRVDNEPYTPAEFLQKSAREASESIEPRNIMRIVAFFADPFRGYPSEEARRVHTHLVEHMLLEPIVREVRSRLATEKNWAAGDNDGDISKATRALAELLRLESIAAGDGAIRDLDVDALLAYALDSTEEMLLEGELRRLQEAVAAVEPWGRSNELAARLGAGEDGRNRSTINSALASHREFWEKQLRSMAGAPFDPIHAVERDARSFNEAEENLLVLPDDAAGVTDDWTERYNRLDKAGKSLNRSLQSAPQVASLTEAFSNVIDDVSNSCSEAYQYLRSAKGLGGLDDVDGSDENDGYYMDRLAEDGPIAADLRYTCEREEIDPDTKARCAELDERILASIGNDATRAYIDRRNSYASVNNFLTSGTDEDFELGTFQRRMDDLDGSEERIDRPLVSDDMGESLRERQQQAKKLVSHLAEASLQSRRERLIEQALRAYTTTDISRHVESRGSDLRIPQIPLSRTARQDGVGYFSQRFNPEAASLIFSDWQALDERLDGVGVAVEESLSTDVRGAKQAINQYIRDYENYWLVDVCRLMRVEHSGFGGVARVPRCGSAQPRTSD